MQSCALYFLMKTVLKATATCEIVQSNTKPSRDSTQTRNMRALLLCIALLQASVYHQVSSLSGGAPVQACSTLSPDPTAHGAQTQTSTVPYSIDLSPFCSNGTYSYYPGRSYTCKYFPFMLACNP